jgi:chemotaxis family two-component system sensor kinase Cph1
MAKESSNQLSVTNPIDNISADILKSTFEASDGSLIITDYRMPDNPIVYCNQAFVDLSGYSMDEIIGRNCRFLQGSDTEKAAVKLLHNSVKTGIAARTIIKNYKKDGTEFYNDLLISPIRDAAGNITHFMGMQLDITERVVAQERLAQRTRELEDANRELEQFTYATSHDLQEPLRMISSYLQLIDKRYSHMLDDDGRTFLGFANEGAERMQALIYDLLALSRISNAEDRYIPTDVSELTRRACENLQVSLRETGTKLEIGTMPNLPVDPVQLTQLFQNLLGNAIKYRAPGQKPVISITAKKTCAFYTFSVTDNGIGIDKQHFERIFVVFQRLHTRSEYNGTGIGLAICTKIVERHNGRIWVESAPGKGSTFKFTLPISR